MGIKASPEDVAQLEALALSRGGSVAGGPQKASAPARLSSPSQGAQEVSGKVWGGVRCLWVPGWFPARLNASVGRHWAVKAKQKKADAARVALACQVHGYEPGSYPSGVVRVSLTLVLPKGKRAADPDAFFKTLADALVRAGIVKDDNYRHLKLGDVEYARSMTGAWGTLVVLEVTN